MSFHTPVLVVSQDHAFRHLLQTLLDTLGVPVGVVEQWPDAAHQIRRMHPDLVILDLVPTYETEAWLTVEALHADAATRDVPVLVWPSAPWLLDGHAPQASRHHVRVQTSPFNLRAFLATVTDLLPPGAVAAPS
jgi:CheY-like chemotaxis protein